MFTRMYEIAARILSSLAKLRWMLMCAINITCTVVFKGKIGESGGISPSILMEMCQSGMYIEEEFSAYGTFSP